MTRRILLADLGTLSIGALVLTMAATMDGGTPVPTPPAAGGGRVARVDLGFVSAYVVVRDGAAALVDTGVPGSLDGIEAVVRNLGVQWSQVGDVVLTHQHRDHVGSLDDVLGRATDARVSAGRLDVPAIASSRPITALDDGDTVFGLQAIHTPGHTPGHISLLDPVAGLLIAGDALAGADGGVGGPDPQYTPDMATAHESVRKLGTLVFDTVVFGHGEPVSGEASRHVAELGRSL